jgi:hypothetical protein
VLIDASILLYATDRASPFHDPAASWLTEALNGPRRVGIPWQSLVAFLRISTHQRASAHPLSPKQAIGFVEDWLAQDSVWIPREGAGHGTILSGLITKYHLRGNLVSDAQLAAIAIEHGLQMYSADSDFARFSELTWINPTAPR